MIYKVFDSVKSSSCSVAVYVVEVLLLALSLSIKSNCTITWFRCQHQSSWQSYECRHDSQQQQSRASRDLRSAGGESCEHDEAHHNERNIEG